MSSVLAAVSLGFALTAPLQAEVDIAADLVSRYVWRGVDFGNSASIQPYISYSTGSVEVGAWSSWALTAAGAGANENDLYVSYTTGPVTLTFNDYYYPETKDFFNYDDDDGIHVLEVIGSYTSGPLTLLGGLNVLGDSEDSFYGELTYEVSADDEKSVSLTAGLGNGLYTTDTDFNAVNLSLNVTRGPYLAQYILNPEAETTFLVFGRTF